MKDKESLTEFLRKVKLSESSGEVLSPVRSLKKLPWVTKLTEADRVLFQSEADALVPFLMPILAGAFSKSDSEEVQEALLDRDVQNRASAYLGQTQSKDCVEQLLQWSNGTEERLADLSTMTLARLGEVSVPAILQVLKSETNRNRMLLCLRFHWHPSHEDASDKIVSVLVEQFLSRPENRNEVGETLIALGVRRDEEAKKLLAALKSNDAVDAQFRLFAFGALAAGGHQTHEAIGIAVDELENESAKVRELAAVVLGRLGEDAKAALPYLLSRLTEKDRYASQKIKKAIVAIGPIGIPEIVEVMRNHESHIVRGRCAAVLSGEAAGSAYDAVRQVAMHDRNATVRYRAARALRMILNRKDNVGYLEAMLSNANLDDRGGYAWNAGPLGQRGTYLVHLWACLLSDDPAIRKETFALVRKYGLAQNREIAENWVTSIQGHELSFCCEDTEEILQRRLEAMSLLDEHLSCQQMFLQDCAKHQSESVCDLAEALLARIGY